MKTLRANWESTEHLNAVDLTLIENTIEQIYCELKTLHYHIPTQEHRQWIETGLPNTDDIRRICENILNIADKYYQPPLYENVQSIIAKTTLNNHDINALEGSLLWLKQQLQANRQNNTHEMVGIRTHGFLHQRTHGHVRQNPI